MDNWILTRRFFLFDSISGIEGDGNFLNLAPATVFRYVKSIVLKVQLDT